MIDKVIPSHNVQSQTGTIQSQTQCDTRQGTNVVVGYKLSRCCYCLLLMMMKMMM